MLVKSKRPFTRIVVGSDKHCGHQAGLTPSDWWFPIVKKPDSDHIRRKNKFAMIQRTMWKWYVDTLKQLQPIDIYFDLGDNTDGRGEKSGGTELITSDTNQQVDMASICIKEVDAPKIVMVYGTPYHASSGYSDLEDLVAKDVGAIKIGSVEVIDVRGTKFHLRHKVGKSSVPHGQGTALAKQWLWNIIWSIRGLQERADVFLRGHIHEYNVIGNSDFLAMSVPGLEWSTKYGSREVDGIVGIGLVYFDVYDDGTYTWRHCKCQLQEQCVQALKL